MKKFLLAIVLLGSLALFFASCTSAGRLGCPTNATSNKPFRA